MRVLRKSASATGLGGRRGLWHPSLWKPNASAFAGYKANFQRADNGRGSLQSVITGSHALRHDIYHSSFSQFRVTWHTIRSSLYRSEHNFKVRPSIPVLMCKMCTNDSPLSED